MSAVILDTETTGTGDDDRVIELAYTEAIEAPRQVFFLELSALPINVRRFSADRPISLGAMATHHILDEELRGLPPFTQFDTQAMGIDYLVGHNVDFDWRMLGRPKVRRICTLALARNLWPAIDSHKLGALVYHLSRDKRQARNTVKNAHSAEADVRMVLDVLLPAILERGLMPRGDTWERLWVISEDARIPSVMPHGKHRGIPMGDVPRDYKQWLLRQPDVDPYLAIALRR